MLRATARVHIPCDGRSLGAHPRHGDAARSRRTTTPDLLDAETRAPERSDSRVVRVVKRIGARASGRCWRRSRATLTGGGPADADADAAPRAPENGFGGLTAGRASTRSSVSGDRLPPAPWSNVIANPHGGFLVTERGGGFTWAANSYFYRLTPWHNDPVSDAVERGAVPAGRGDRRAVVRRRRRRSGGATPYTVRHGPGASFLRARARGHRHAPHGRHGRRRAGQALAAAAHQHAAPARAG